MLDQQLAATLQAQHRRHGHADAAARAPRRCRFRVSGVALVTAPDELFQPLNPLLGPAPAQPPANIAILPLDTFAQRVAPDARRRSAPASRRARPCPGAQTGVAVAGAGAGRPGARCGGSPAHALQQATQIRNRVERSLPGQVQFVDNLADTPQHAPPATRSTPRRSTSCSPCPGALVALGLAYLAALGTVERDRRDLALLRARGARRRDLVALAGVESVVLGLVAGALGAGASRSPPFTLVSVGGRRRHGARARRRSASASRSRSPAPPRRGSAPASPPSAAASARARRSVRRAGKPLWQRLYLDVVALAVSGLVYWLTARTGFSAVVNPDSNPTLSLSVYMFLAPALLWLGAALLLVRLRGRARRVDRRAAPPAAAATTPARLPARERRAGAAPRSTAACSCSGCCSPSASTSASSPPPTTSRRASTRS